MTAARIHVCSLELMSKFVDETSASHLVSLINGKMMPSTPACIDPAAHLQLEMNDIASPMTGLTLPSSTHVAELIRFVQNWDQKNALIIHCWAGISRSTAAALIALSVLNPEHPEEEIAWLIRSRSPTANPNMRLIETADTLLARSGRLLDAIDSIGIGEIAHRGVPFSICADLSDREDDDTW